MSEKDESAELDELLEAEIQKAEEVEESTVQPEETPEAEAGTVEEETFEIPEELKPFSAWKEDARQAWESGVANEEMREILKQIRPQLDSDYQYRTQLEQERAQLQGRAQYADYIEQLSNQYGDLFQGRNPVDVIGNYLYHGQQLARDPQNTIQKLAKDFGVDLNSLVQDQPYVDETTQALQSQLQQMQQQFHYQQQAEMQRRQQQVMESANAFESETDAEGNLAHPYVGNVVNEMIGLMKSGQVHPGDWKTAYEKACWANPEVREELLKEQGSAQKQQRTAQAQRAKAAAAAQPKPGKSSTKQPRAVESVEDALEKGWNELQSA